MDTFCSTQYFEASNVHLSTSCPYTFSRGSYDCQARPICPSCQTTNINFQEGERSPWTTIKYPSGFQNLAFSGTCSSSSDMVLSVYSGTQEVSQLVWPGPVPLNSLTLTVTNPSLVISASLQISNVLRVIITNCTWSGGSLSLDGTATSFTVYNGSLGPFNLTAGGPSLSLTFDSSSFDQFETPAPITCQSESLHLFAISSSQTYPSSIRSSRIPS